MRKYIKKSPPKFPKPPCIVCGPRDLADVPHGPPKKALRAADDLSWWTDEAVTIYAHDGRVIGRVKRPAG